MYQPNMDQISELKHWVSPTVILHQCPESVCGLTPEVFLNSHAFSLLLVSHKPIIFIIWVWVNFLCTPIFGWLTTQK